ncbi:hypothetical protein K438DRAFT_1770147 [Mycena galopus ATCC 62051]|nr:hypothetical protein K438DRAFT_1770147 [Mycena galopus ATCC 62051]
MSWWLPSQPAHVIVIILAYLPEPGSSEAVVIVSTLELHFEVASKVDAKGFFGGRDLQKEIQSKTVRDNSNGCVLPADKDYICRTVRPWIFLGGMEITLAQKPPPVPLKVSRLWMRLNIVEHIASWQCLCLRRWGSIVGCAVKGIRGECESYSLCGKFKFLGTKLRFELDSGTYLGQIKEMWKGTEEVATWNTKIGRHTTVTEVPWQNIVDMQNAFVRLDY